MAAAARARATTVRAPDFLQPCCTRRWHLDTRASSARLRTHPAAAKDRSHLLLAFAHARGASRRSTGRSSPRACEKASSKSKRSLAVAWCVRERAEVAQAFGCQRLVQHGCRKPGQS